MSVPLIIGAPQSPLVWATRFVATEKGLAYETVLARPHSPEVLAISPFGRIPVLRHGPVEIAESQAIAGYLDGLSPQVPLVPASLAGRAKVEQWLLHFHTEFLPVMLARYIAQYFFPKGPQGTPDRGIIDPALPQMNTLLDVLDRRLQVDSYVVGDFSLVDAFFGPLMHYVRGLPEGGVAIQARPRVAAYVDRVSARPAFKATLPPPFPARSP